MGQHGKEYRLPTEEEIRLAVEAKIELDEIFAQIPFGLPDEPLTLDAKGNTWCVLYGVDTFQKLFTLRQLLALGTFVNHTRAVREAMQEQGYSPEWVEAVSAYFAVAVDRLADYSSAVCSWHNSGEQLRNTFGRFALPFVWDFTEVEPCSKTSGGYLGAVEWIGRYISHPLSFAFKAFLPHVIQNSAIQSSSSVGLFDIILTDPPYYDAIGYRVM